MATLTFWLNYLSVKRTFTSHFRNVVTNTTQSPLVLLSYPENCQHQPSKHGRAENDGKQKKRLTRKKNYALICCFALLLEDQHACLYNISLRFGRCVCQRRLPIIPFLWVAETLVYPQRSIFPALGRSGGSFNTRCNLILGN